MNVDVKKIKAVTMNTVSVFSNVIDRLFVWFKSL
jgi:hypothetical protein